MRDAGGGCSGEPGGPGRGLLGAGAAACCCPSQRRGCPTSWAAVGAQFKVPWTVTGGFTSLKAHRRVPDATEDSPWQPLLGVHTDWAQPRPTPVPPVGSGGLPVGRRGHGVLTVPAPQAPDWVDAEECHRCRVQFGVVTRKVSECAAGALAAPRTVQSLSAVAHCCREQIQSPQRGEHGHQGSDVRPSGSPRPCVLPQLTACPAQTLSQCLPSLGPRLAMLEAWPKVSRQPHPSRCNLHVLHEPPLHRTVSFPVSLLLARPSRGRQPGPHRGWRC